MKNQTMTPKKNPLNLILAEESQVRAVIAITRRAEKAFGVTAAALERHDRSGNLVDYRSALMWALYHVAGISSVKIGLLFDNRNHATVLHALKRVEKIRSTRGPITPAEASVLGFLRSIETNPPR